MATAALKIPEVFTPRSSQVNLKTYVPRLDLERMLLRSINGSMHSLLFGESGNGKSWMYKKVLDENDIRYKVANCANASRIKSITQEIVSSLTEPGTVQRVSYHENKEATVKAVIAEGKITSQNDYKVHQIEPLAEALARFRKSIGNRSGVIVLDNLESIFSHPQLMDELADILILLDDERYGKHNIKFLIVGVPNGVLEYFAKTKNLESVSNRIEELPKVSGLNIPMVKTLVNTGFNELLKFRLSESAVGRIAGHTHHVTMGVAQRVQEYCEKLAYNIEENRGGFTPELLQKTDFQWLLQGMRQGYTVVESHLNSKRTTIARRNQIIYCIGKITAHQLDSSKVTAQLIMEFPDTSSERNMGVGSILAELASGDAPLLRKNPNTNDYRVCDPRYIMCIRVMLRKREDNVVEKIPFAGN